MFGRRKQQQLAQEEAAREAERRALFEELAKRPDTICPFLGLENSRTEYRDRVSDGHRCYAFGDPAELSAEQQGKVCLQRGYGNCPRYLRGVLVIPTEELEALRRPQPLPPPPSSAPAPEPVQERRRRGVAGFVLAVIALLAVVGAGAGGAYWYLNNQVESSAATATLPGGTGIGAELVSLSEPGDGGQRLRATAFIGESQATANTALVYVFDLSGSARRGAGCGADRNGDGLANTPLDCEIAAATALNEQAVESGIVAEVGMVGFANEAVPADLAPAEGFQGLVSPGADEDGDGKPDVVQAMESAVIGGRGEAAGFERFSVQQVERGQTAFSAGIEAACALLAESERPNRLVIFLSDGVNRAGQPVSSVLPCGDAAVFHTFAAGSDASCTAVSEFGTLEEMASITGGTCTTVAILAELPQVLEAVVAPQLVRVELTVDGGEPTDISSSVSPALPEQAPAEIEIDHAIPALADGDHRLCLTVHGSDAGGSGSVTSCSPARAGGGRLTTTD